MALKWRIKPMLLLLPELLVCFLFNPERDVSGRRLSSVQRRLWTSNTRAVDTRAIVRPRMCRSSLMLRVNFPSKHVCCRAAG